jgi:hypothetical protein
MAEVLIQSISRQVPRVDDVLRTARVWQKKYDVLPVDESEAKHYLQHPMEWRKLTPDQYEQWLAQEAKSQKIKQEAATQWTDLTTEQLRTMRDEMSVEITRREAEAALRAPIDLDQRDYATSAAPELKEAPATVGAMSRDIADIVRIVGEMDVKDPEQFKVWDGQLEPRVPIVSERVGRKVSVEQVREAWAIFKSSRLVTIEI